MMPNVFTTDALTTENAQTTISPETTLTMPVPSQDCCGQYPQRFPYRTQGGDRGCCENPNGAGVTYNANFLQCCADGSTLVIGACF